MLSRKPTLCTLCLLILSHAACGTEAETAVLPNTDETTDAAAESTEVTYPAPEIEAVDCEGRELRIAVYDAGVDARIPYSELGSGEQDGEVLNDAIYDRNLKLAEK